MNSSSPERWSVDVFLTLPHFHNSTNPVSLYLVAMIGMSEDSIRPENAGRRTRRFGWYVPKGQLVFSPLSTRENHSKAGRRYYADASINFRPILPQRFDRRNS